MTCSDLERFFDGELTADQASQFRDHLAFCAECQKRLEGLMQEATATERTKRA